MAKIVPCPGSLQTLISSPCPLITPQAVVSPKPLPPFVVKNGSNIRSFSASSILIYIDGLNGIFFTPGKIQQLIR